MSKFNTVPTWLPCEGYIDKLITYNDKLQRQIEDIGTALTKSPVLRQLTNLKQEEFSFI